MSKRNCAFYLLSAGVGALLCFVQPSIGADLPSKKEPPVSPPAFTWTGLYLGANFGYTWTGSNSIGAASANVLDQTLAGWGPASALGASGVVRANLDGFVSGIDAGYNWQFADRLVAGVEADIQGAGVRGGGGLGNITPHPVLPGLFAVTGAKLNRSLEYFGTARARLGYAVTPNLLLYATGGLAYGGADESATIGQSLTPSLLAGGTAKGGVFENRLGWTAGAGVEWAMTRNLSAKFEYLYYDLGSINLTSANINPLASQGVLFGRQLIDVSAASTRFDGHMVRAGLNYRFDWSEPETNVSGATPLLAAPRFVPTDRLAFGDWRFSAMQYMWATAVNGNMTAANQTVGVDASFIDFLTKTSAFPLSFMGRFEAQNGPVAFYGDLAWMQLRLSGSTFQSRSPFADIAVGVSADAHLKETIAIGEAGGAYELARWKLGGAPNSFTAFDAYAGLRYWYINTDLSLDLLGGASSQLLGLNQVGALAIAKSGSMQWIDPVLGLRMRHEFAPGQEFQMRGDVGGFGVGSKFSWELYGGYAYDFEFKGLKFTTTIGYRALSVDYAQQTNGRQNGINAILHGPVSGLSLRF